MFQLIAAVISIALATFLAIASILYGGTAFTNAQQKAQAATLINIGQQVTAAYVVYTSEMNQESDLLTWFKGAMAMSPVLTSDAWVLNYIPGLENVVDMYTTLKLTGAPLDSLCLYIATQTGNNSPYFTPIYVNHLPYGVPYGCIGSSSSAGFHYSLQQPYNQHTPDFYN